MASRSYGYFQNLAISFDQLFNSILGGSCEETLSAVFFRWHEEGKRSWPCYLTDALFFWQEHHCYTAYLSEIERKQYGDAYKGYSVIRNLKVIRANLRGSNEDWALADSNGSILQYSMDSKEFLDRVSNKEISFNSNTYIRCRVYLDARITEVLHVWNS